MHQPTLYQRGHLDEGDLSALDSALEQCIGSSGPQTAVALEGTPLYAGQPWDVTHDVGYNVILRKIAELLELRGVWHEHIGLFDEYSDSDPSASVDEHALVQTARRRSSVPFSRMVAESGMVAEARRILTLLRGQEFTRLRRKESDGRAATEEPPVREILAMNGQPLLVKENGRYSCALLDAAFQNTKGAAMSIIVHPESFLGQQKDMRAIRITAARIENIGRTQEQSAQMVRTIIGPDITEEHGIRERAVHDITETLRNILGEALAEPKVLRQVGQRIRSELTYHLNQERRSQGFRGLTAATNTLIADATQHVLPAPVLNVFFDERGITRFSVLDRSCEQSTNVLRNGRHESSPSAPCTAS